MSANLNKCKAWLIASNLIDQIIRYKENLKMKAIFNLPFSWTGHKPNRTSFICKEKKKKNVSHTISHYKITILFHWSWKTAIYEYIL